MIFKSSRTLRLPLTFLGNYHDIKYESLEADPVGEIKKLYENLSLEGWEEYQPYLEAYLSTVKVCIPSNPNIPNISNITTKPTNSNHRATSKSMNRYSPYSPYAP